MTNELELLRGMAGEHGRCLDIMADARRAKLSGDRARHAQLVRELRIAMEQRDSLHTLWRRAYAGQAMPPAAAEDACVLPIHPEPAPAA